MSEAEDKIAEAAKKFALKNARDYGTAQASIVINKIFAEIPDAKKLGFKALKAIVDRVVGEVNSLSKEEIEAEAGKYVFPEKEQREGLPDLPWADAGTSANTRFAPNPSGYLTIGHSKIAILCDEYSKKYPGKFFVRFEDTDPKTKEPKIEAYKAIVDDLEWLGCKIAGIFKQSDRLEIYYKYAKQLLESGKAYVCTCTREEMQRNRKEGISCACRSASAEENLSRWEKMQSVFKEGEAVVRMKTDMQHPNPSVRDWLMLRIIDKSHPLTGNKYRIWPLYNFSVVIDDHDMGINLVIRGKEHEMNSTKQKYLYDALGWEQPHTLDIGILKPSKDISHKSDIKKAIQEGRLTGWDDPRAPTVAGFRKRGILPGAIREYVISSGIGKNDSYLDIKKLEAINRKLRADAGVDAK
ncbi:MAG: glutamate--tRNA ligase [Candidatus Marsarchaeota archaeon]|jgi:glutamyl-tRNA synthetase|nr:glutamate--tRNA ligase [Candidatus Marsarchaeota archaeon]MCL5112701.1 glutamate--tRNA ligase [Candidatus Marsarchaeota archaeon]